MLSNNPKYIEQLIHESKSLNIQIDPKEAQKQLKLIDLLIEKNKVINLTRITENTAAIRLHIIDSLLLSQFMDEETSFIDIGTGAGFPGLPLLIHKTHSAVLLDSVKKKTIAVDEFINELNLDTQAKTSSQRVEEFARTHLHVFDYAIARAVAPLPVLIEYAAPLLKKGGKFICSKGKISKEEISAGNTASKLCGLRLIQSHTFELPDHSGHREIFIFQNSNRASIKLPRAIGMAKKHPLA